MQALQLGNTVADATAIAGVSRATVYAWLARGEQGEPPFADFLDAVKKAFGIAEVNAVAEIYAAAERGEWQAAAWLLERRKPERWGRTPAVSASHAARGSPATSAAIAELYTACAPAAGLLISVVASGNRHATLAAETSAPVDEPGSRAERSSAASEVRSPASDERATREVLAGLSAT